MPERGDQVIVESLPIDATLRIPAPAAPIPPPAPKPLFVIQDFILKLLPPPLRDPAVLLAVIIAAGVLLASLGLAVFWFLKKRKQKKMEIAAAVAEATAVAAVEAGMGPTAAAIAALGPDDGRTFEERLAE